MSKEPDHRPDVPELIRRAEQSAERADAARERLVTSHRADAASQERLARLADDDGRTAMAAGHREAAARETEVADQLSRVPGRRGANRRREQGSLEEAEPGSAQLLDGNEGQAEQ